MAGGDRERWDAKYAQRDLPQRLAPNEWLMRHIAGLPSGVALDLATGMGHNAIALARHGLSVAAVDISRVALGRARAFATACGTQVQWIQADLDDFPIREQSCDCIVVCYFLDRALPGRIVRALRPGGVLIYETFTLAQRHIPGSHITNLRHMLRPGELLGMFRDLRVRHYRDAVLPDRAVASLVAEKGAGVRGGG